MTQEQEWTFGKTLLTLFIVIDLIVIGVWLFIYFEKYQQVVTIVSGIWAALLALLAIFGIRSGKIGSLSELFNLKPIKFIGVTLTVVILAGSAMLVLWEFESHLLEVTIDSKDEPINSSIMVINVDTKEQITRDNEFQEWLKIGSYKIKVTPNNKSKYKILSRDVTIHPFQLKVHEPFNVFTLKPGALKVKSHPKSVQLLVTLKDTEVFANYIDGTVTIPDLEPGKYIIEANAPHYDPYKDKIEIAAGLSSTKVIKLKRTTGTLFIKPPKDNMQIFINGKHHGKTPSRIKLEPGSNYIVVLMKLSQDKTHTFHFEQKAVRINANSETPIQPSIPEIKLRKLGMVTLIPLNNNPNTNITYKISDPIRTINLGSARFGKEAYVFPGNIIVEKYLKDQLIDKSPPLSINLGQDLEVKL